MPGFLTESQVFLFRKNFLVLKMVYYINQRVKHMNKIKLLVSGIFAMGLITMISCTNNSDNKETDAEELPNPQEGGDQERYNINAPDEEVIKLDSTAADTTITPPAQ